MNISIWSITYQHYDEIINQLLNTCIILVGGRSDLFNSGGRWSKGGEGIFFKKGGVKQELRPHFFGERALYFRPS